MNAVIEAAFNRAGAVILTLLVLSGLGLASYLSLIHI